MPQRSGPGVAAPCDDGQRHLSDGFKEIARFMPEWVDDRQVVYDLTVLQILGKEVAAAEFECRGEKDAIPPRVAITAPQVASQVRYFQGNGSGSEISEDVNLCKRISRLERGCLAEKDIRSLVQDLKVGPSRIMSGEPAQPVSRN